MMWLPLMLLGTLFGAPPGGGQKYALLIGVAKYEKAPPLSYCEADVEAMRKTLVETCGYAAPNVRVLSTAAGTGHQDWPTLSNILDAIDNHLMQRAPDDTVLFYFSGHGIAPEANSREDYLMPVDASINPERVPETCLSYSQLCKDLQRSGAGQVVLIVDACRVTEKGATPRQRDDIEQQIDQQARESGVVLLRSCKFGEVSREVPEFQQGAYTHFLVQALSGAADGYPNPATRDGKVTAEETQAYVHNKVVDWSRRAGMPQTPTFNLGEQEQRSDIVLAQVRLEVERQARRLTDLEQAGTLTHAEADLIRRGLKGEAKDVQEHELAVIAGLMLLDSLTVDEYLEAGRILRGELKDEYAGKMREQVVTLAERGAGYVEAYRQVRGVLIKYRLGPPPTTGSLVILVAPVEAEVQVGNQPAQRTQGGSLMLQDLPPGDLNVVVRAQGYQQETHAVKIEAGQPTALPVTLRPIGPPAGRGMTITLPGGARMDLVRVPAGSFTMGSTSQDIEEQWRVEWDVSWKQDTKCEQPAHRVELDGFWIGRTEVTVEQWKSVMGQPPVSPDGRQYNDQGDDHPVVCVSWDDVQSFCQKAGLSLPTEAQWEYAARGPQSSVYPWGDQWDQSRCQTRDDKHGYLRTAPVGSFPSGVSWCGALDMAGNVFEWCLDWYDKSFYGTSAATARNPECTNIRAKYRVNRGGDWNFAANVCRSAYRNGYPPDLRVQDLGFRASQTR